MVLLASPALKMANIVFLNALVKRQLQPATLTKNAHAGFSVAAIIGTFQMSTA